MRIGRDHIASTVYTIAFATAGAALSVLLLISIYDRPLLQIVQTEQFAGEIIRTLVGAIGLVLAVPLTTAVGVAVVRASHSAVAPPRRLPLRGGSPATSPRVGDGAVRGPGVPEPVIASRTSSTRRPPGSRSCGRGHRRAAARSAHAADETGVLPATKWRTFGQEPTEGPAPVRSPGAGAYGLDTSGRHIDDARAETGRRSRRSRRREEDDDFGDFTYLREPDDTDPGPPPTRARVRTPARSRGRRAR